MYGPIASLDIDTPFPAFAAGDHARAYSPLALSLRDATLDRDAAELAAALRLTDGRVFAHRPALVWFLAERERALQGRSLALPETYRIGRIADAVWALSQASGMAVVDVTDDEPQGPTHGPTREAA